MRIYSSGASYVVVPDTVVLLSPRRLLSACRRPLDDLQYSPLHEALKSVDRLNSALEVLSTLLRVTMSF